MFYVVVSEFASPTFMDLSFSITMVVWAAVGGRSSILGACIGAILINMISATVSETPGICRSLEGHHRFDFRFSRSLFAARLRRISPRSTRSLDRAPQGAFATCRRGLGCLATGRVNAMADIALTVDELGVDFGGFKAVNGVSLTVEDGELRVLLGANGAGKTTLMDLISGKTKCTEGRVFLHDIDITNWEEHKIARAGVGRKFQIPSVFKDLTVRRNLEVASCRNPGVMANLRFGFNGQAQQDVDRVLELIGLTEESAGWLPISATVNPVARAGTVDHAKSEGDPAR